MQGGFVLRGKERYDMSRKKALSEKNESIEKNAFFMSLSLADAIRNAKRKRSTEEPVSDIDHALFGSGSDDDSVNLAELHRSIEQEDQPNFQRSEEEAFAAFSAEKIDAVRMETRDEEHTQRVLKTLWAHIKTQQISKRYFESSADEKHSKKVSTSRRSPDALGHDQHAKIYGDEKIKFKPLEQWNTHLIDMILMETNCPNLPLTDAEKVALIREHIIHA